jgi:hypothetical protein
VIGMTQLIGRAEHVQSRGKAQVEDIIQYED